MTLINWSKNHYNQTLKILLINLCICCLCSGIWYLLLMINIAKLFRFLDCVCEKPPYNLIIYSCLFHLHLFHRQLQRQLLSNVSECIAILIRIGEIGVYLQYIDLMLYILDPSMFVFFITSIGFSYVSLFLSFQHLILQWPFIDNPLAVALTLGVEPFAATCHLNSPVVGDTEYTYSILPVQSNEVDVRSIYFTFVEHM